MRLTAIAAVLGCWKLTVSLGAMLKLCQLADRFWLVWLIVVVSPDWLILPAPETICPPVGSACPAAAKRNNGAISSLRLGLEPLPRLLLFSATATKACFTSLQTRR
nr:hypothetical protein [Methylobacter tundripaludum]